MAQKCLNLNVCVPQEFLMCPAVDTTCEQDTIWAGSKQVCLVVSIYSTALVKDRSIFLRTFIFEDCLRESQILLFHIFQSNLLSPYILFRITLLSLGFQASFSRQNSFCFFCFYLTSRNVYPLFNTCIFSPAGTITSQP